MTRIEEILPKEKVSKGEYTGILYQSHFDAGYNKCLCDVAERLEKAVSKGKLCLDPPTAEEIYQMYHKYSGGQGQEFVSAMVARIRNGGGRKK